MIQKVFLVFPKVFNSFIFSRFELNYKIKNKEKDLQMEPNDFKLGLNSLMGAHMPNIINFHSFVFLTENERLKTEDVYRQMDVLINKFKNKNSTLRLLSKCLLFLKQHYNIIRHRDSIKEKDITKALLCLPDLLMCLSDLAELNIYSNLDKLFALILDFYNKYHGYCANHIKVPNYEKIYFKSNPVTSEISQSAIQPSIIDLPQHKTVAWYKENGLAHILKEKTIIFEGGLYGELPCKIIKYNQNNTKCEFADGNYHFIAIGVPLRWE